jgi:hypothetical protein
MISIAMGTQEDVARAWKGRWTFSRLCILYHLSIQSLLIRIIPPSQHLLLGHQIRSAKRMPKKYRAREETANGHNPVSKQPASCLLSKKLSIFLVHYFRTFLFFLVPRQVFDVNDRNSLNCRAFTVVNVWIGCHSASLLGCQKNRLRERRQILWQSVRTSSILNR